MINFDSSPVLYWFIGYLFAVLILLSTFYNRFSLKGFLLMNIALFIFMRLPALIFNAELNADESQMLSHGITLYQDPVYWRAVDGTTIGPLDLYILSIPKLLGFQINYMTGRVVGLFCILPGLLFLFFALKNWFGDFQARKIILLPLFFLAFTQEKDFVHYSSEQLPFLLIATGIWLLSVLTKYDTNFIPNCFLLGLISGAVPFAKLQGVPITIIIVLSAMWLCYQRYKNKNDLVPAIFLFAGGLAFPFVVLLWTLYYHVFNDMIDFYIISNLAYADENNSGSIAERFLSLLNFSEDFEAFTFMLSLTFLGALVNMAIDLIRKKKADNQFISAVILALTAASIYAVTKSGRHFVHYLSFCIIPWTLLAALGTTKMPAWISAFPVLLLIWFLGKDITGYQKAHNFNLYTSDNNHLLTQSPVVKELKKYTRQKDYLVVWGWKCSYYVEAQLAQGTAENHTERSIYESELLDKYRSRFLADMERTKPAVFLDATGKNSLWLQNRQIHGIQTFPALANYIKDNYNFMGDFDETSLYVKKASANE